MCIRDSLKIPTASELLCDQPSGRKICAPHNLEAVSYTHLDVYKRQSLWNRKLIQGFSGGQRQRIMLSRALITDPKLLFADEPTSMQDVSTRWDLVNLLKNYHQRGMSLIFVTHDLLLAKTITQKGIVLYRGLVCEEGPTASLLTDPLHPYTKALSAALPRLGKAIKIKAKRKPDVYKRQDVRGL